MSELTTKRFAEKDLRGRIYEKQDITDMYTKDEDLMADVTQDEDEDEEHCEEFAEFVPIIRSANLDRLPAFAIWIRRQNMIPETHQKSTSKDTKLLQLNC